MIEVYAIKTEKDKTISDFNKIFPLLSSEKNGDILIDTPLKNDLRTLIKEAIIRQQISKKTGCNFCQIEILLDFFGKPYCKQFESYHFNISHSGEWVVCAFDNEPIGIDIQKIIHIPRKRMDLIVLRFFHKSEQIHFFNLKEEEKDKFFFTQWVIKESYIKLLGKGFQKPLQSFSAFLDQNGRGSISDRGQIRYFQQYDIDRDYKLVVCSSNNSVPPSVKKITIPAITKI